MQEIVDLAFAIIKINTVVFAQENIVQKTIFFFTFYQVLILNDR
jgi:hypothetical protein